MVGINLPCPHCRRTTLNFELNGKLLDSAIGADLQTALKLCGLKNVTYWCARCGKVHILLWQPDAKKLDLRDTIKRAKGGEG